MQGAGRVLQREDDRGLGAGARRRTGLAGQEEEPRVVLRVVFDLLEEDLAPVRLGGQARGDGGAGHGPVAQQVHHAAGGVVGRHRFEVRAAGKELPALRERHRMRSDLPDALQHRPRPRDQAMPDPELRLGHDVEWT